ncbi:hypothetical protein DKX38_012825 [Salix brachista]|uniref:BZIP domain-containing protein n=1 Tax=Salix brachista TaxID=2182728 RepID=A0A5N5LPR8_9ROSI|nr:hypothetical protein DKX38_012825 [Salix brachista]
MATSRIFHAKSSLCNILLLILQNKIEAQTKQKQSENYRDCEEAAKHASVSSHHHRRCHLHRESPLPGSTDSRVPGPLRSLQSLSLMHLQTLTTELKLLCRENADLKVANSELVKLVSLAFQASVMQHQQCTLGNNRAVAFERRNSANNVGTESSSGAKMPSYDSQTLQVLRC